MILIYYFNISKNKNLSYILQLKYIFNDLINFFLFLSTFYHMYINSFMCDKFLTNTAFFCFVFTLRNMILKSILWYTYITIFTYLWYFFALMCFIHHL